MKIRSFNDRTLRLVLLGSVVAVGTAALSISLLVSARLDRLIDGAVDGGGRRVVIANAELRADSSFDWQLPPAFTPEDKQAFLDAGAGIRDLSIINELPWRRIEVEGAVYRPGTVLGSDEGYASVMGLRFVAGSFFSAQDVASRSRVAVLSSRAAEALFGDAGAALGKTFRGDRNIQIMRRLSGGTTARAESTYDAYTVVGVFSDVSAFERDAYGVPDYIVPYTVMFPADLPIAPFVRILAARTDSRPYEGVAAALRSYWAASSGKEDLKLSVWEGAADRGGASTVQGVRNALRGLSLAAELFGLAILAVAAFGIVSGMMAEAAERRRELAIKRALGRSSFAAALELCAGGVKLAAAGALLGFVVALAAGPTVAGALAPFLEALGVGGTDIAGGLFEWRSLGAPISAVALAALFSLLPALRSAGESIVEGLR